MKRIALLLALTCALFGCATFNVGAPSGEFMGSTSEPTPSQTAPHKLGALVPQRAGDFFVSPTAASPFKLKDGTSTVLSAAASGVTIGPNGTGATLALQADAAANVEQFAGGTQGGLALGSALSTTGHLRIPNGWLWRGRNAGNTGDASILAWDSSNYLTLGDAANISITDLRGFNVDVTAASAFSIRDGNAATAIAVTPSATGPTTLQLAAGVTSFTLNQAGSSGTAGANWTIQAQTAGATNDGGSLTLAGGGPSGTGTVYGSTVIGTPLNISELTFTPVAGANSLTAAQSAANVFLFGTQASAFTINIQRRIADKSLVFVRNPSGNGTATISYLTGGTVSVAAATSALIVSDGTNLQKIMSGT